MNEEPTQTKHQTKQAVDAHPAGCSILSPPPTKTETQWTIFNAKTQRCSENSQNLCGSATLQLCVSALISNRAQKHNGQFSTQRRKDAEKTAKISAALQLCGSALISNRAQKYNEQFLTQSYYFFPLCFPSCPWWLKSLLFV